MSTLWKCIDSLSLSESAKYKISLLLLSIVFALVGFAAWNLIRSFCLNTLAWEICFVGYPVVISWFVVFFYSINHSFHEGIYR